MDPSLTLTKARNIQEYLNSGDVEKVVWVHPAEIENACSYFGSNEYRLGLSEDGLFFIDPSGGAGNIPVDDNDWEFEVP
jgi:hypothetical protein